MDFKINISGSGSAQNGSLRIKTKEDASLAETLKSKKSLDANSNIPAKSAGSQDAATLTISNLKNYVDTAKNAVESIGSLRATQLKLAKEASSSPQDSRSEDLNDEVQVLQDEIERVASSSTYNGIQVLGSARTLTAEIDQGSITSRGQAVSLGDASALSSDLSLDLSSQDSADSAIDSLEGAIFSTNSFSSSLDSAKNKIDSIGSEAPPRGNTDSQLKVDSPREARDLSKDIAYQVGSPFQTEEEKQLIIEASTKNLDEDKVLKLLED
jgi:flagellin-like hook-associated protein FlgL